MESPACPLTPLSLSIADSFRQTLRRTVSTPVSKSVTSRPRSSPFRNPVKAATATTAWATGEEAQSSSRFHQENMRASLMLPLPSASSIKGGVRGIQYPVRIAYLNTLLSKCLM